MAYRFKLNEPFEEGSRRIAREQIERAQRHLRSPKDRAVAVHETRKVLKRVRALLRLIRPAIGDTVFHAENVRLRDIAQILSGTRDRHVLMETVIKLEAAASLPSKGVGDVLRRVLQATNGGESPTVDTMAMKQAKTRLAAAKRAFAHLRVVGSGFNAIGPGLEASYRKGRRAFKAAYSELTDEAFHEWRKGVQQHWRHMLLLSPAWPDYFAARVNEARELSQVLGDDHDLTMLIAFVRSEPTGRLVGEHVQIVEKLARQRQQELRAIAHPAGARLFAEGARGLRRRMALYWTAAGPKMPAREEDEPTEPKVATPTVQNHSTRLEPVRALDAAAEPNRPTPPKAAGLTQPTARRQRRALRP